MASEGKFHSRIYFLCPHCKKAPRTLPGHLRTVCMRGSSEEDIQATVIQAKKKMAEFSHTGRFWEYQRIRDIFGAADPLFSMLKEMNRKGLVVRNAPPLLPSPYAVPQSSSRYAESEPPVESDNQTASEEYETASEESYQSTGGPRWTSDVRVELTKRRRQGSPSREQRVSCPESLDGPPPKRACRDPYACFVTLHRLP